MPDDLGHLDEEIERRLIRYSAGGLAVTKPRMTVPIQYWGTAEAGQKVEVLKIEDPRVEPACVLCEAPIAVGVCQSCGCFESVMSTRKLRIL